MSSSSKDKGDRAERDVVDYIKPYCPNIRRGKAGAEKDLGDLFNYVDLDGDPWTIQIADRAWRSTSEIEAKVATAAVQAERAGTPWWVCIVKRAGCTDVGKWWAYMDVGMLIDLIGGWCDGWDGIDLFRAEPHRQAHGVARIDVSTWLALTAPEPAWTPEPPF